jgi:Flp pilus assembly protein CpaB
MKSMEIAVVVFAVLVALGVVMLRRLVVSEEKPVKKVVAKRDVPALTLLKSDDLEVTSVRDSADPKPTIDDFKDRFLLIGVTRGTELKPEMVASSETTKWLTNAVAVSIPSSPSTSLGGQLDTGDWVALTAFPSKEGAQVKKFEKLMVLNVVSGNQNTPESNAIILAVPSDERDEFVSAIAGSQLVLTRKIAAD